MKSSNPISEDFSPSRNTLPIGSIRDGRLWFRADSLVSSDLDTEPLQLPISAVLHRDVQTDHHPSSESSCPSVGGTVTIKAASSRAA